MESVLENYSLALGRLKLVLSMLLLVIVLLIGFVNSGIIWAQETSEDSELGAEEFSTEVAGCGHLAGICD